MNIGITERGDAGLDLSWKDKLDSVDAAVIITKNITDNFRNALLEAHRADHKLILHATCTGLGGTVFEPNVPTYRTQINALRSVVDRGFPIEQIVLRVDPIFPDENYVDKAKEVIDYALKVLPDMKRIRISVMDLHYRHLQRRFLEKGVALPNNFKSEAYIDETIKNKIIEIMTPYAQRGIAIETCAEPLLASASDIFQTNGCVSNKDLTILGLNTINTTQIGRQRPGACKCLPKTELLTRRAQCPHRCLYCFWV